LVYAADAAVYASAVAACGLDAVTVYGRGADTVPGALSFESLMQASEGPAVMQAHAAIQPDDVAKYLLTSGSIGTPKVAVNTHRMLCANQQMIGQAWRFLDHVKPVLLEWLPWSYRRTSCRRGCHRHWPRCAPKAVAARNARRGCCR
jgi:feruloyl-CoA synthase